MLDALDNIKQYGSITLVIISLFAIFISGLFFGATYYIMDHVEGELVGVECVIDNNTYFTSCQDMLELSIYPFLQSRELLVWMSFFFIFALVLGMLITGYQSGKSPALLGVLVVMVTVITYFGIELSNIYRGLLDNVIFRSMMTEFTVYNKIMLNFPWFAFFVGLFAIILSVVNYQKSAVNENAEALNY